MPRRQKFRNISYNFPYILYKPAWVPQKELEIINLQKDELEAIRLIYIENINTQQWAEKMNVSAATFNRIVNSWLKKVARAIIYLKWLKLED